MTNPPIRSWTIPVCRGELVETDLAHDDETVICDECGGDLEWVQTIEAEPVIEALREIAELNEYHAGQIARFVLAQLKDDEGERDG